MCVYLFAACVRTAPLAGKFAGIGNFGHELNNFLGSGQRATGSWHYRKLYGRLDLGNANFADASSRERELNFGRDSDSR
jgi:hypothetical protein